ncbi:MAG: hypothetical protein KatS3mg060_2579 [Dehalococcoidia bacterium]|nr:MAG: hypothetical protein KatS3mg060_2579 [Dehalococcoidia bacterium]
MQQRKAPRLRQRLVAAAMFLLACWVVFGTPVRPVQAGAFHLHADDSARPLHSPQSHAHHELLDDAGQHIELQWGSVPLVAITSAGDFIQALIIVPAALAVAIAVMPVITPSTWAVGRADPPRPHPPRVASLR